MKVSKVIPKRVSRSASRMVLRTRKQSPHILFGVGISGVVGGTVLACRSTLRLEKTLEVFQNEIAVTKENIDNGVAEEKELVEVYIRHSLRIAKLYAPAGIVGGVGIACLVGSHGQLTKRNGALTAAYAGLASAYDQYRERVREEVGEEKELKLFHGLTSHKIKEDGKTIEVQVGDPNELSIYAVMFDESNRNWQKDAEWNKAFLKAQNAYFNNLLQIRGHVFLNEVLEHLGFEHTRPGSIVGWCISKDGDNYIDFGLYSTRSARFINGDERSIILDFNVDGVIWDSI